jgi:hypothetical protein
MDGYYGATAGVNVFETDNWAIGTSNTSPNSTYLCPGYWVPTYYDYCSSQCQSQVTLTTSVETIYTTFATRVNGYILNPSGQWVLWSNEPLVNLLTYPFWADASQSLQIGHSTLMPGTTTHFYTGLNSSTTLTAGSQPPVYQIHFPHWNCDTLNGGPTASINNPIFNYVLMVVKLPPVTVNNVRYQCCNSGVLSPFTFFRTCNASYPKTNLVGDPQFTGLRGQEYQVHGIDGGVYNIISSSLMQLNSRFVFLTGPRPCPLMPSTGKKSVACFTHSGSYLENLALVTNAGDRLLVESGPAEHGINRVEFNSERLSVGDHRSFTFTDGSEGSLTFLTTHEVLLTAGLFNFEIENSDGFVNLRSVTVAGNAFKALRDADTHGLLGQTWKLRKDKKAIDGRVDDYFIESEDLFGTDFMYNKFQLSSE